MVRFVLCVVLAVPMLMLMACASFDGRGLVAGRSTAAEVGARMGATADRIALANGDTVLYFSRQPAGRAMYVVTLAPDGVMKSIDQRITRQNFAKIVAGVWTGKEVRELLGPPALAGRLALQPRDWWEYKFREYPDYDYRVLWVQFSEDGVVRELLDMPDPEFSRPSGAF